MTHLIMESPDRLLTRVSPMKVRAKYSGGPKARANLTRGGAIKVSRMTEKEPAMNDDNAAIPRAGPARPLRAIWYPSSVVMTDADSPGTLMRMDVVDPPYMAP